MRLAIFIPAYNAEATLASVLDRIPEPVMHRVAEIVIIDNASTDDTYNTANRCRDRIGLDKLTVLRNDRNLGYGGSQKRAFHYVIDKGYDGIVMLHSDGQYAPEEIQSLIEPLESGSADMVMGSRLAGDPLAGGMPIIRYFGNKVLTSLTNLALRWKLTEYHSGYRAYRCDALRKLPFDLCGNYYHFDVDIIVQAKLASLNVQEVTIKTHYGDEECHQNTFRTGMAILGTLGEYTLFKTGMRRSFRLSQAE